jgi:hypothetical protein
VFKRAVYLQRDFSWVFTFTENEKNEYSMLGTLGAVCHTRDDVIAQNAPSPDGYGAQSPTFT